MTLEHAVQYAAGVDAASGVTGFLPSHLRRGDHIGRILEEEIHIKKVKHAKRRTNALHELAELEAARGTATAARYAPKYSLGTHQIRLGDDQDLGGIGI